MTPGLQGTVKPVLSANPFEHQNWFSILIMAECRSNVLQNAPRGVFCNTFNLHLATIPLRPLFCLFLSGCLRFYCTSNWPLILSTVILWKPNPNSYEQSDPNLI